ncbi:MAG: aminopeptidase N [Zoogloeaceae bacterium]|jgi:aminopeptidase N|nr:aminopeptidase N [Zoogloeaceae bacterium]
MQTDQTPRTIYLKDYAPPPYLVETVVLHMDFQKEGDETVAFVSAETVFRQNPAHAGERGVLVLDGEELETLLFQVDGRDAAFEEGSGTRTLRGLPEWFVLKTRVRIHPDRNTRLTGLYRSRNGYFTQCEAEGFRRITWFSDRPDVMTRFTVTVQADKADFPALLSNGNRIDAGESPDGRHYATWRDPFRKPCYLFALVAAKLDALKDVFTTASGRKVNLAIYAEPGKLDQCAHAMLALKKAMRWDEERFGLECDLDHYMIAAVSDFNMGAMENKGLNVFNAKYVLARSDVATDADFEGIDRVVAHEYFHNWTGNRVTCRDWFQLSLKEGLTVFRDQEFGADVHDPDTARLREVRALRATQFPEDAGPMAHPVRPASYMEINNFYTATVYEKGAEVVRMIQTLVGREAFRAGMDTYFARHDGEAVTCDDFVAAMADASGFDLTGAFMRWYAQPGTPHIAVRDDFDPQARRYTLRVAQSNSRAEECLQGEAQPCLMPIKVTLFDTDGAEISGAARTLVLNAAEQEFHFENLGAKPTPSLLRDFSAPVTLDYPYTSGALMLLLAHERDPFAAWEAGQRLAGDLILAAAREKRATFPDADVAAFAAALRHLLVRHDARGAAFVAEAFTLPGESTLAEMLAAEGEIDPDALHAARDALRRCLAKRLETEFSGLYTDLAPQGPYRYTAAEAGRRALRNLCLSYLLELDAPEYRQLALAQFETADNMTDRFAALAALANLRAEPCPERTRALEKFYADWRHETLAVDKWLAVQAASRRPDTLAVVEALTRHPAFDPGNPNKIYALVRTFGANLARFHAADGAGYRFMAEQILTIDARNPQVASRLARTFDRWQAFDATRRAHGRAALERLRDHPGLSRDVFEVANRALGASGTA